MPKIVFETTLSPKTVKERLQEDPGFEYFFKTKPNKLHIIQRKFPLQTPDRIPFPHSLAVSGHRARSSCRSYPAQ